MDLKLKQEMEVFAIQARIETLKALGHLGFGHVGGAFSIADLVAVLYNGVMKVDPKNPAWKDRDYLVCSKGHAGPILYSTLAMKGYFPMENLLTINKPGTTLPSHCDRNLTPGIDMTTGSLGQGSSMAVGIALGNRMDGRDNYTYLILGDGEIQEGQVWEAASFAAQKKLNHLIAFVDWNKKQLDGPIVEINDFSNVAQRFEAFGWNAVTVNGHDVEAIYTAIEEAKKSADKPTCIVLDTVGWNAVTVNGHDVEAIYTAIEEAKKSVDKPTCIVLDTVKGKGCSFAENAASNHHINISQEQMAEGLAVLEEQLAKAVAK